MHAEQSLLESLMDLEREVKRSKLSKELKTLANMPLPFDIEEEMQSWRASFNEAFKDIELALNLQKDETFQEVLEIYDKLNMDTDVKHQVLQELASATNLDERMIGLFDQRCLEIDEVSSDYAKSVAHRIEELKKTSLSANDGSIISFEIYHSKKDPYTMMEIKVPVKNKICGHVHDKNSAEEMINSYKKRNVPCQCPVLGCKNKQAVTMEDLLPFPEFFSLML